MRIVGYVPTGAFELHSWGGNDLLDFVLLALGAGLQRGVGKFYDALETMSAVTAQIFV